MFTAAVVSVLATAMARSQTPADAVLANEVTARQPRSCVLPPLPPYQGRSLWNANLWPGGVVPYEFDANTTAGEQSAMRQSMNALEAAAYVHFVARTGQGDYIHVLSDSGNFTEGVGDYGGQQNVHIYNWNYEFIMCHELMHALGVRHEQARSDRDQYITVNYSNIQSGWGPQYDIQPGTPVGPFDFDSVMCYGACGASTCCPAGSSCSCASSCWTMTALPAYAQYQGLLGNITHLSNGDITGLASRYGGPSCAAISQQPAGVTAPEGASVSFTVAASGQISGYRWLRNGSDLHDDGRITGSATATLSFSRVLGPDQGSYAVVVSGPCADVTSASAALTVTCARSWYREADSPVSPGPRWGGAMTFDESRGEIVMFGGGDGAEEPYDTDYYTTWIMPHAGGIRDWIEAPATGPAPRDWPYMDFSPDRSRVILFGGRENRDDSYNTQIFYNDTWEWNGSHWEQRATVHAPSPRFFGGGAYDRARHVMVVYGGGMGRGPTHPIYGDTWEYDGNDWTQRSFTGPTPGPRQNCRMVYDQARHVCVLWGGHDQSNFYTDTWEYDGNSWVRRSDSLPGYDGTNAVMAYDSLRHQALLSEPPPSPPDLMAWDGVRWSSLGVNGTPTGPYAQLAFDPLDDALILYGGANYGTFAFDQRWALTTPRYLFEDTVALWERGAVDMYIWNGTSANQPPCQWRRDGVNLEDDLRISGTHTHTLVFDQWRASDFGHYDCVVTNECGSFASTSVLVNFPPVCTPDFNGDGDVGTDADIEAFFACLAGNCCATCGRADFNADGDVGTDADIESFFRVIAGGAC